MENKDFKPANEREKKLIKKIFRYLVKNINQKTDLLTIANECGTTENFLDDRLPKLCNEQSIVDIKRKIRLLQTVNTMMRTNAQLKELYKGAGYSSPGSFDRAFKKTFGITPQTYISKKRMRTPKNGN